MWDEIPALPSRWQHTQAVVVIRSFPLDGILGGRVGILPDEVLRNFLLRNECSTVIWKDKLQEVQFESLP